jgi:hypothetical protein
MPYPTDSRRIAADAAVLAPEKTDSAAAIAGSAALAPAPASAREIGGPTGPEPTRFGDWEKQGRCIDF